MVIHTFGTSEVRLNEYYINRISYNIQDGSVELRNADMADSGIYEYAITTFGTAGNKRYYDRILEIQDGLLIPMIIQNPTRAANIVYLNCIVKNGETTAMFWLKGGEALQSDATYELSFDNRTLTIKTEQLSSCTLYTCVIRNQVSQTNNSHLLIMEGLVLLHELSFTASVIALVSTSTSYAVAIFIINVGLGPFRVHRQHVQLTSIFVFFKMLSLICQLIAAMFCVLDPEYPISYRVIEGLGLLLVLGITGYLLFLFLRHETILKRSFLMKKKHRHTFLVYGALAIILSSIPIYQGFLNITQCQLHISYSIGNTAAAVVVYVFLAGIIFVLFVKNMMSWAQVRRLSRISTRSR
uniref:uncharacterized protein n=1 Tax=Pristiophorus japonicus TaxID=55135 RepID=UPI00398E60C6